LLSFICVWIVFFHFVGKQSVFLVLAPLFGGGIFSVSGHEWLVQRKAASNAFRVRDIISSLAVFQRVANDLVTLLDKHDGQELDFQTLLVRTCLL
jgi:cytochrome P450